MYGIMYGMNTEKQIIDLVTKSKAPLAASEIVAKVGKTRTYVSAVLSKMVKQGVLRNRKEGRRVLYFLAREGEVFLDEVFETANLREEEVYFRVRNNFKFNQMTSEAARSIFEYGFQEMLNNAIEHSCSQKVWTFVAVEDGVAKFVIRDFGVGAFRNVKNKLGLGSEYDAILEIMKGKNTTSPKNHTGMGIFFTSKIADKFRIDSYGLSLGVDNVGLSDVAIRELETEIDGTEVTFEISADSDKSVVGLFQSFSMDVEEGAFDRTEIKVRLYERGVAYVSRTQARMMMKSLEKFKKVTLDFQGVDTVGQAFADEVFRVFKMVHPEVEIEYINAKPAVRFMIDLAKKGIKI